MNDINEPNDNEQNEHDTTPASAQRRPLGYWLRAVDELVTREFPTALEAEGIGRRDWMLLNVLSGDVDAPELRDRLARKGKRLRDLEERGWVVQHGDGTWSLTDLGRSEKERIGSIVDQLRQRVVGALGGDEAYAALTASLEAVARELGWDESEAGFGWGGSARHGFRRFGAPGFPGRGFAPGFGGRLGPFDPEFHRGHHGFRPGHAAHPHEGWHEQRPGHAGHPFDDGCSGHHPHAHHGLHGPHGHPHAHHGHGHGHGHGHRHGRGRGSQRAYERGFDAGFARGREAGAA
jgi:hypothetical protein